MRKKNGQLHFISGRYIYKLIQLQISVADNWHLIGNELVIDWLEILHYWINVYWLFSFVDFHI